MHAVVPTPPSSTRPSTRASTSSSAPGRGAVAAAKALIPQRRWRPVRRHAPASTAEAHRDARVSPEGQEGLRAFLEKRQAAWREDVTGAR